MQIEQLQERSALILKALEETRQSLLILQGHKAELDFQISEMNRLAAESNSSSADEENDTKKTDDSVES